MSNSEEVITDSIIKQTYSSNKDFAFEIEVLRIVISAGYNANHSGVYCDPVTGKFREFDIRAEVYADKTYNRRVALALECKNLGTSSGFLFHSMQRKESEAFHQIITQNRDGTKQFQEPWKLEQLDGFKSYYHPGGSSEEPSSNTTVAKKIDFLKLKKDKLDKDRDGYELISQAINSCKDLIEEIFERRNEKLYSTFICPVVVVPDGRLWQVIYDSKGEIIKDVHPVEIAHYFVSHPWVPEHAYCPYRISHVAIVTLSQLKLWLQSLPSQIYDV